MQDAYVRAFRSWKQYTPGTNLRAWLLRIVHNLAVDAGRKRQRTPQMEPVEESDYYLYQRMGGTSTPEEADNVVERLSQGGVVSALAALPQPYRDAVVLVDLADFSYQDAADILDVPIGTIMSRLHRGTAHAQDRARTDDREHSGGCSIVSTTTGACGHAESRMQAYLDKLLSPADNDDHRAAPGGLQRLRLRVPLRAQAPPARQGLLRRSLRRGSLPRGAAREAQVVLRRRGGGFRPRLSARPPHGTDPPPGCWTPLVAAAEPAAAEEGPEGQDDEHDHENRDEHGVFLSLRRMTARTAYRPRR